MPTISVIIPTHNRSRALRRTIASVLRQTMPDFELIVVDDASVDDTQRVVEHFAAANIKYICHAKNQGAAAARNTGISNSHGKYIAFLDDDDEWLPDKLRLQFARLEASPMNVGAIYTGWLIVHGLTGNVLSQQIPWLKGDVFDSIFVRGFIAPTSTFLCRRSCFEKVGLFDESLQYCEDHDMWLRIAKEFAVDCVDEPLVRYTDPDSDRPSLSTNYDRVIRGQEAYFRKYAHVFVRHPAIHSVRRVELGVLYCYNGNMSKGRASFRTAMRINALEPRTYFNFALSLLGARLFKTLKLSKERCLLFLKTSARTRDCQLTN